MAKCAQATDYFSAPWQKDLLFSVKWGPAFGTSCNTTRPASGKYNFTYDVDGRRTATWDESAKWKYTTAWTQHGSDYLAGIDSVFKSATFELGGVPTSTYTYYYDAFGRRRAKMYPDSTKDEFFYDQGHQMLADRGNNSPAGELPEDDYVWLDGRPVMMVRGKFTASTMARLADGPSTFCNRNEEQGLCGTYAIVTDYLGKPVLTLNSAGNISGTGTYEAFGFANRREYRWGSSHFANSNESTTITPPMPASFDGPLRVLTSRSKYSFSSSVTLAGNNEAPALLGDKAHAWTSWRYAGGNSWTLAWLGNSADYGIDVEAYEVQAKQAGTWWAWAPLRFPGHYYDKETELNENWNRYFDPRTNRYLSPEPLLRSPSYVRRAAQAGRSLPSHAYANNNPVRFSDPDGRKVYFHDEGIHWSISFDLSCQPERLSCEPGPHNDPKVLKVDYWCAEKDTDPMACFNGASAYSAKVMNLSAAQVGNEFNWTCDVGCHNTAAALDRVLAACGDNYMLVGHNCRNVVMEALAAAGCGFPNGPPGYY